MTHVWNSSACLLILSWRRGIRKASPASQKNRERLSDILLTPSWKTRPALSTSFLREVLLACTVHFTKCLWTCLNPSQSALLVCHHPYAICKFGSESKLKVSLLQFKPTISCTIILAWFMLLARNTVTSRNPFLCLLKTAVKWSNIACNQVFILGQMFPLFKMWKEITFCLEQIKKKGGQFWKYNLPSVDFHRNDWLCKWAAAHI